MDIKTSFRNRVRRAMAARNHPRLGVMVFGHRDYVGAHWEELGSLQFRFMVDQGLLPHHVLVDIACGSLRGGVHFIPYLDPGNYLACYNVGHTYRLIGDKKNAKEWLQKFVMNYGSRGGPELSKAANDEIYGLDAP